jgi:hypothetical protein
MVDYRKYPNKGDYNVLGKTFYLYWYSFPHHRPDFFSVSEEEFS